MKLITHRIEYAERKGRTEQLSPPRYRSHRQYTQTVQYAENRILAGMGELPHRIIDLHRECPLLCCRPVTIARNHELCHERPCPQTGLRRRIRVLLRHHKNKRHPQETQQEADTRCFPTPPRRSLYSVFRAIHHFFHSVLFCLLLLLILYTMYGKPATRPKRHGSSYSSFFHLCFPAYRMRLQLSHAEAECQK